MSGGATAGEQEQGNSSMLQEKHQLCKIPRFYFCSSSNPSTHFRSRRTICLKVPNHITPHKQILPLLEVEPLCSALCTGFQAGQHWLPLNCVVTQFRCAVGSWLPADPCRQLWSRRTAEKQSNSLCKPSGVLHFVSPAALWLCLACRDDLGSWSATCHQYGFSPR